MSQRIFVAAALSLLAIATGDVAAQTAQPAVTLKGLPPQHGPTATISRVDPLRALQDQVAELKAQVAALKQANEALAAKVQTVDGGLGQVVTQNVAQTKQINDLSSRVNDVSTRLVNHRHPYTDQRLGFHTESFVTESGGVASSDKVRPAMVYDTVQNSHEMTGPAE